MESKDICTEEGGYLAKISTDKEQPQFHTNIREIRIDFYDTFFSAGNVTKDFAATAAVLESAGIKFPSTSGSGVTLRSQRMKLPQSVGQKKTKAIEQMLGEIDVELAPIPTEVRHL